MCSTLCDQINENVKIFSWGSQDTFKVTDLLADWLTALWINEISLPAKGWGWYEDDDDENCKETKTRKRGVLADRASEGTSLPAFLSLADFLFSKCFNTISSSIARDFWFSKYCPTMMPARGWNLMQMRWIYLWVTEWQGQSLFAWIYIPRIYFLKIIYTFYI